MENIVEIARKTGIRYDTKAKREKQQKKKEQKGKKKNGERYVKNIELQKGDKVALAYLSALTAIIQQISDLEKQKKEYEDRKSVV